MINIGYLKLLLWIMGGIALTGYSFRILKEYERGVIFRLGKLHATKGPGLIFLIPFIDVAKKIDLRLISIDVPRQDIMTKDNVPVTVDAVVYFHIVDPAKAVITIQDIYQSTYLLAQATLRNVLGQEDLDHLLSQQEKINKRLQEIISIHTRQWGINISIVEIKEVTLPEQMKRAMAKQAETERERRARIIDAQAEYQASRILTEAGRILSISPQGLQLRYLQTLRDISTNKGSSILFPFPIDLLGPFLDGIKGIVQRKSKTTTSQTTDILMRRETEGIDKTNEIKELKEEGLRETALENLLKEGIQKQNADLQGMRSSEGILKRYQKDLIEEKFQEEILSKYKRDLGQGKLQPTYVQWVITDRCQSRCAHCEIIAKKDGTNELKTSQCKKLIDNLFDLGCQYLFISGGEPMMRDDLFEIIDYAKDRGFALGLTTNGLFTEKHLKTFVDTKFELILITLDGYGNTLNRIMNFQDAYERGIRTIEFFHNIGMPRVYVSSILIEENFKEFPRLTEDVFRAGANTLHVRPQIFYNGKPKRNSSKIIKDAFKFILEARRRGLPIEVSEQFGYLGPLEQMVRSDPFFCGCGWNTFCVTSGGKVQGCPAISKSDVNEGDIKVESLQKIWQKGFVKFRKDIPDGLQAECYNCPHLSACRGGCWLLRVQGLDPCFLVEANDIHREITNL